MTATLGIWSDGWWSEVRQGLRARGGTVRSSMEYSVSMGSHFLATRSDWRPSALLVSSRHGLAWVELAENATHEEAANLIFFEYLKSQALTQKER